MVPVGASSFISRFFFVSAREFTPPRFFPGMVLQRDTEMTDLANFARQVVTKPEPSSILLCMLALVFETGMVGCRKIPRLQRRRTE